MSINIRSLIQSAHEKGSSDIHLGIALKPKVRIDGMLIDMDEDLISSECMEAILKEIVPEKRYQQFIQTKELDFSFFVENVGNCRVNLFFQKGHIGMAIRILPGQIWTFEKCGLDENLMTGLANTPTGLILVTGATGSGKTTTLASIVDYINQNRACHIITVEDPIEFIFENKKAKVDQREIGEDTDSFSGALKYVLRQDPDVVLVGEMRDLETIETALNVAETGHLVLATLHTSDAVQTINRVIDVFPEHKQQQVRTTLSFVLNAVFSQRLIPKKNGGRALASEIMIADPAIRSLIRESKVHQLYSSIQTGFDKGMRTMNASLAELVHKKDIGIDVAINNSSNPEELLDLIERTGGAK